MPPSERDIQIQVTGQMDTLSPDGSVKRGAARLIVNYVGGRRFPGLRIYGKRDPGGFLNQDLHDQLLGAVGSGGYVEPSGPPVFVTQPVPTTVSAHGTAILYAYVSGARPMTYQWFVDGVEIDGETKSYLYIHDVIETHTYWVIATNGIGSAESNHVNVGVNDPEDVMSFYRTKFDTVAEMLASDARKWLTAEVANFSPGDKNLSIWNVALNPAIIPNGMDILQTTNPQYPPITVYRTFARENTGGTVYPGPGLDTYTATVPLDMPTINDLKLSRVLAPRVTITNPDTPYTFVRGDSIPGWTPGVSDDENQVTNAVGIHYVRWRGV